MNPAQTPFPNDDLILLFLLPHLLFSCPECGGRKEAWKTEKGNDTVYYDLK